MVLEIKTFPDKILRGRSEEVTEITDEIQSLIYDMADTMYSAPGIGLAAPQVGVKKRIIVIDITAGEEKGHLLKLINPVIVEKSGEVLSEEGCLSIPGEYEKVKRFDKVVAEALDIDGNKIRIEAEDLLARALQHEIDHLEGVLFLDHLTGLKKETVKKHIKRRIATGDYVVTG